MVKIKETAGMKCQSLFIGENKRYMIINLSSASAKNTQRVVKVNSLRRCLSELQNGR